MGDTYKEVIVVLAAGTFVSLVLSGIVIFVLLFYQKKRFAHRYQMEQMNHRMEQELLRTQLETQENTFRQISDELHDNVGQLLSSAKILLAVTERKITDPPESLGTAAETLSKAMQELRALSKSLNREWLQRFNLVDNLRTEADRINMSRSIVVEIRTDERQLPVAAEAQVMLFRIIQEALQNCLKHAGASSVDISISSDESLIRVLVRDNGKGFVPDAGKPFGLGLSNMRHRTQLLGGDIQWQATPGQGTLVTICLPIQRQAT